MKRTSLGTCLNRAASLPRHYYRNAHLYDTFRRAKFGISSGNVTVDMTRYLTGRTGSAGKPPRHRFLVEQQPCDRDTGTAQVMPDRLSW